MQLKLESRVESLEQRTSKTEAGIIQLSSDIAVIRQEIKQDHMDIGNAIDINTDSIMKEIRKRTEPIETRLDRVETRLDLMDGKLDQILQLLQTK
jgi:hypothetical protein